jgi:hypothetical protein
LRSNVSSSVAEHDLNVLDVAGSLVWIHEAVCDKNFPSRSRLATVIAGAAKLEQNAISPPIASRQRNHARLPIARGRYEEARTRDKAHRECNDKKERPVARPV